MKQRRNHYDVTNRVRVSHPQDVAAESARLLEVLYPEFDSAALAAAFETFGRLYAGLLPGYVGCDTWYHDAQHSLDCALTTARLIDGHERAAPAAGRLGPRRALLGLVIALYHDAGYIRRDGDRAANGAEFTLSHVRRSSEFLESFLPQIGYADSAALAGRIVHFTGYEMPLDAIDVQEPRDRMLGFLVGTADLLAQTADRCYPEKCRDFLYPEFELCGLAGRARDNGPALLYRDRRDLLNGTQTFNDKLWSERLDGYFGGVHRYLGVHFEGRYGGCNPYVDSIRANLARVARAIREPRPARWLSLRPEVVGSARLREILGLTASVQAA
ncbi:MAG: hypothetical protein NVS9B10_29960 [Nevskia sp.]